MSVVIETTIGDFTVDLFTSERPQTCKNFLKLCKIKYYNWHLFHTVQSNFIAQTGDPTGTGKGGESIYSKIIGDNARYYEAEQIPKIRHGKVGLLSMVNCGDNLLGSQFFITLDEDLQSLDGQHCVFGEIVEGLDIVLKFNESICDNEHRPYQDIRISHTVILDDPYDDPEGLFIPERSPSPTKEYLESDRIRADECIDDTAGMTAEEINEMRKEKEAKAAATILEIVGDIPDAEIAPPENVLFVCKLNPVTNDDDLEIIFSRFGKIIGCEVIRDRKTNDSLQYAFIEFADRKSCEDAYFKMDNVLIDDRRIHVDFSQSVSKMRWKGKGRGFVHNDDKRAHQNDDSYNNKNNQSRNKYRDDYRERKNDNNYSRKNKYLNNNFDDRKNNYYHDRKYRKDEELSRYDKNRDYKKRDVHDRHDRFREKKYSDEKYRDRSTRDEKYSNEKIKERSRSREKIRERSKSRDRKDKNKIEKKRREEDRDIEKSKKHKKKRSRDRSVSRERSYKKKNNKKDRRDY